MRSIGSLPRDSSGSPHERESVDLARAVELLPSSVRMDVDRSVVINRTRYMEPTKALEDLHTGEKKAEPQCTNDYWRQQFMLLSELRYTEPEEQLQALKDSMQARERILTEINESLEQKLRMVQEDPQQSSSCGPADATDTEKLEIKVERQRRLLSWYEKLTSMSISEETPNIIVCTAKNKAERRVTKFQLQMDECSEEIIHTPLANAAELPDCLQDAIKFDGSFAPLFLRQVMENLYRES